MKKLTPLFIATACLAVACKDKGTPEPEPEHYDNYTQLKVGNYWVYQIFDVDSLGQGPPLNEYDSCSITKDTVINGNRYYYLSSLIPLNDKIHNHWLRDSLHYLVDDAGSIRFSSKDFTTAFSTVVTAMGTPPDTMAVAKEQMESGATYYNTPAGPYTTLNFKTTYEMYPGYQIYGKHRYLHQRHAKDIGIVSATIPFFAGQARYRERRLIRYHLN